MKARIRCNIYDNWYGYLGQRRVEEFGAGRRGEARAAEWLATQQAKPAPVKRGYSRDFKPRGNTGKRYLVDGIPAGLWSSVRERCKRDGVSVRAQILTLLTTWVGEGGGNHGA